MGQSINSIKEFEQRSPQLGYISSFNTCSHVKSSLMHNPDPPKIMHERDFYMGTCLEGDSAHSLAWRGPRGDLWRSAVGMIFCHFCSLTPFLTVYAQFSNFGRRTQTGGNEAKVRLSFFSSAVFTLVSALTSLRAFFLAQR